MMARVDLHVPFAEKDEAKVLGARWDPVNKVWYVPDSLDNAPFKKWMPEEPDIQIRSSRYFIAESATKCWKCGQSTKVYGFVVPSGHEVLEEIDVDASEKFFANDDEYKAWCKSPESVELRWVSSEEPTIIHFVDHIPPAVALKMQGLSRHYRVDYSKQADGSYWMNHCEHCGMKQGDFNQYAEPGGAFFPVTAEEAFRITLYQVDEPFSASYGASSASMGYIDMSNPDVVAGINLFTHMPIIKFGE